MAGGVTIRNNRVPKMRTAIERAASRALNRAAVSMNTVARRQLAAETGLAQKAIRRRMRQEPATAKVLSVAVGISGVPVRAIQLGARQGPLGTTVGPRGARTLLKSAFIAKGRRGRAVFRRTTRARGPLEAQLGEPLAVVATREHILEAMLETGAASFEKNYAHEVNRALSA